MTLNVKGLVVALLCAGAICLLAPAAALAGPSHLFDPTLSLTGDCSTSEADLVPDPGLCPIPPGTTFSGSPGADHPSAHFADANSVTTDSHGDVYVANFGPEGAVEEGKEGRIDVFGPDGRFITELKDENGPRNIVVDGNGNLYVKNYHSATASPPRAGTNQLVRYEPSLYEPEAGRIAYQNPPAVLFEGGDISPGMAIGPEDHLFINGYKSTPEGTVKVILQFGSAGEGNPPLEPIGEGSFEAGDADGLAIDVAHGRIYSNDREPAEPGQPLGSGPPVVRAFELEAPHAELAPITAVAMHTGSFGGEPALAVEEESGDLFTYFQAKSAPALYELSYDPGAGGSYVGAIEHDLRGVWNGKITVDNSAASPNRGYLYVPSDPVGIGHLYAFAPSQVCAPEIAGLFFPGVSDEEADLRATVDPCNAATTYTFQYTTQAAFEAEGFAGARTAGGGDLRAVKSPLPVSVAITGLTPGSAYRVRLLAQNEVGTDEAEGSFATYPAEAPALSCPNAALRSGPSASLPDCRAYELVSPGDTNTRAPRAFGHFANPQFGARQVSPGGEAVSFSVEGGTIPGYDGTGSFYGDPYLATRKPEGWSTAAAGPNGSEAATMSPGSTSPDEGYSLWQAAVEGSAVVGGEPTNYVRYPDGHSALVGRGSLGTDPRANGKLISEGGGHIVFVSGSSLFPAVRLEEDAPPADTHTVYDRTADEVTHVVSLLPGTPSSPGGVTPAAGEDASYVGASPDGRGIAFSIGSKLYLRLDDAKTYEVGENLTFEGLAEGGGRLFYLRAGNLYAFDAATGSTIAFSSGGGVIPVNVAAAGTVAYFVSPTRLGARNPEGDRAQAGKENLYRSQEGTISFIGTLTTADVEGEFGSRAVGLGTWGPLVAGGPAGTTGRYGLDPSRATPDGTALLFVSRAQLGPYDPEGHPEVYRYDVAENTLLCLSCLPTGGPASGQAGLQTLPSGEGTGLEPLSIFSLVENLRVDGRRAFFESTEALVPADTDGVQDVYEWEAQGVRSCPRAAGCVSLISSGYSAEANYLYGVSRSGDDVFFASADLLTGGDRESTYSIYDARVDGGFAEAQRAGECLGEACQPALAPPVDPTPRIEGSGNVKPRHCAAGRRPARRHGKVRCVKPHRHHHRRHRHHHRHRRHRRGAGHVQKGGHK